MALSQGTPWKTAENRTLKRGSSPPRAKILTYKCLPLSHLYSKMLGQIQYLVPHRLTSRLQSKTTQGETLRTRPYFYQRLDAKDDIDRGGGRRGSDSVTNAAVQS